MSSTTFALFAAIILTASAVKIGDDCSLGDRQRIGKGSYYEECVSKYETAGCFASWEKNEKSQFVSHGETIDRMYKGNSVGFRYKCEMSNGYISFAPIGCVLNKKQGLELLELNGSGQLDNGQNVKCKQNNEGEFSFEFGSDASVKN
uniref:Cyanovirin-N domain-containing protein n=1 Tax=Caenorhabditis japonica TaxID=281687 RepID=A0A8R1HNL9_CAEJA